MMFLRVGELLLLDVSVNRATQCTPPLHSALVQRSSMMMRRGARTQQLNLLQAERVRVREHTHALAALVQRPRDCPGGSATETAWNDAQLEGEVEKSSASAR